jgi:hypothetical protein
MKTLIKISIYTLLLSTLMFTSCKEDELPEADRIFSPVGMSITTSSGIGICDLIVKWDAMPGAHSYTIVLSKDSLQFNDANIIEKFVTEKPEHTFPNLRRGQLVTVSLRSNSHDMEHDSYILASVLRIPIENIFFPALSGDVKATSITMRYPMGAQVTHLKLTNVETGEIIIYPLSEEDSENGIYKMTGVAGETNYIVEIYYEDEIRGQREVTTAYAPSGPNVIYLADTVKLSNVLTNADYIGKILVLPENHIDTIKGNIEIVGGMTIYGHPDGERASIESTTGSIFRFSPNASEDIEFIYCNFWKESSTNTDYIFNMNAAFGDVSKLAFTNCRFANFRRNFFRVQGGGVGIINNLNIDNCEFDGMGTNGDYGFFHIDVAGTAIRNISIKNTTFNVVGCHFIYFGQSRTIGCQSVTIENCTFYNAMYSGSARWFINLGNVNNPENSIITLKNVILGSTVLNSTADPLPVHNGIKRENVTIVIEEVYQTNDWLLREETAIDAKIYNGKVTDLFADPAKGNFAIKDSEFAGKNTAGDPRWR